MAQGRTTAPDIVADRLDASSSTAPDTTSTAIARVLGAPRQTIVDMLAKYQPVADELRGFKRDHYVGGWQWSYLCSMRQLERLEAYEPTTLKDEHAIAATRRDLSVSMGIATEKTLLLSGMPTQIVAGIHEVRVSLPELAQRLAEVSRAVSAGGQSGAKTPAVVVNAESVRIQSTVSDGKSGDLA